MLDLIKRFTYNPACPTARRLSTSYYSTINEWGWVFMKNYRDRGGCYHSSEISIILHMMRKLNSIIFLLFMQIILSLKTSLKHAYLHRSINVKFIFDSARLGLFRSANILQIEDVAFKLVSCCSCHVFSYFLLPSSYSYNEWNFSSSQPKQLNLVPRSSRLTVH